MERRYSLLLELGLLTALVVISAALRLYQLADVPPGLHGDEALTGLDALRVLNEGWIGPYVGTGLGQPSGPLYWTALVFNLFGASTLSLRASMAVLGILTIPAAYLLYRTMFNPRVAVLGASLLAVSHWHIHYSRIAFMLISMPLLEILALFLLFKGFRTQRRSYFLAGGVLLGLGLYTYNVFPLFLAAVAVLYVMKLAKDAGNRRRLLPQFGIFWAAALASAFPFLAFVVQNSEAYLPHFQLASIFNNHAYLILSGPDRLTMLAGRLGHAASLFFWPGLIDGSDGFGGKPLLDPLTGVLFASGMFISLWKWREERHFILIVGVLIGLLGSALTIGAEYRRMIVVLPFTMAAAGVSLDFLWRKIEDSSASLVKVRTIGLVGVVVLALGYAGFFNTSYYFTEMARRPSTVWVFSADLVKATEYLGSLGESTYVYYFGGRWAYNYETRRFLLPQMAGEDRSREFGSFSLERTEKGPVVYLFFPPYDQYADEVRRANPGGEYFEHRQEGKLFFNAYYLR